MTKTSAVQRFVLLLRSNWISWIGAIVTTSSFLMMVTFFLFQVFGGWDAAYSGMLTFLILPGFFVGGLVAIPAGLIVYRKNLTERVELVTHKPLHLVRILLILTAVNLVVVGTAGYQGFRYMESVEFCGTLCHTVMQPQYVAYLESPHARVACVDCHIGEGASWFVKSKLSGARQVFAVMFDTYQTPIPTPVENLRPARETCEECHWPEKFTGDRLVVRQHYEEDLNNSKKTNVLVMKTGGTRPDGTASGIHWHIHSGVKVTYVATDDKRMEIPWIQLKDETTGREEVFTTKGVDPRNPPEGEVRTMDCIDCHNQPAHKFELAETALDEAMAVGLISPDIPWIRKVGLRALHKEKMTRENAPEEIRKTVTDYYSKEFPLDESMRPKLDAAIAKLGDIWLRNIFPEMDVNWGTYRGLAGHHGCVRCHDDEHRNADGEPIPRDCNTCHVILAYGERNPNILQRLGIK